MEEFEKGTRFHRVYPEMFPEELKPPEKIERVLFCTGQVYYDLLVSRKEFKDKVFIVTVVSCLMLFQENGDNSN